ncbi:FxsB family cyclophane-forming radical SAM/SPASM peptide maturase [Spirulina sp. CCNP1310]|uniref:FxsB family cyclophane-forming radical SAM/SPASM peptide maturase n=1 Tax=Spirulina sp. CCNP1310 TaxID=3110249 RepID=UPI002B1EBF32|nr:FxsB family cyclophane-forming radical SAM/SPASM peptide maturase [Spirulina sp. CCNP1310]MEA5417690.1 FxsB family cyclophane-forming radical SAM/SPASM peptide maturase [Spirulina sp. CCNP1310]
MNHFTPLRSLVCKVISRCNINCDYCYMYHGNDQSWQQQPLKMAEETIKQLGKRINEHTQNHQISEFSVIMHGGEPLLGGLEYLESFQRIISQNVTEIELKFGIQTNGILLSKEIFDFCVNNNISIGLSMDGYKEANDQHRLDYQGRSSFEKVEKALELLNSDQGKKIWSGFLCVIDLHNDPQKVYSYLSEYSPRFIDFLLPLNHHNLRPFGKEKSLDVTPYADWLLKVFDMWYHQKPQTIRIRKFEDIVSLFLGLQVKSEEWGLNPIDFAVIETNGDIEAVDTLKVTYPEATKLGMNIFTHSFDDIFCSSKVIERQEKWKYLSTACQECKLVKVCGGGYLPHRYSQENQFQNPSVYCSDLKKIITTIRQEVIKNLEATKHRHLVS